MQRLFEVIPHKQGTDSLFAYVVANHLVGTWIFAAVFYLFWQIEDERTEWRRTQLFKTIVAFAIAVPITLVVRPWISWPSPARNIAYQHIFPTYLWGNGSYNSFPSHSTLLYFTVALGIWPLSRPISGILISFTLLMVSLPRVFVGGHYPIDVISSIALSAMILGVVWRWRLPPSVGHWLAKAAKKPGVRELLLAAWLFEVGEEFGGTTSLLLKIREYFPRL